MKINSSCFFLPYWSISRGFFFSAHQLHSPLNVCLIELGRPVVIICLSLCLVVTAIEIALVFYALYSFWSFRTVFDVALAYKCRTFQVRLLRNSSTFKLQAKCLSFL